MVVCVYKVAVVGQPADPKEYEDHNEHLSKLTVGFVNVVL